MTQTRPGGLRLMLCEGSGAGDRTLRPFLIILLFLSCWAAVNAADALESDATDSVVNARPGKATDSDRNFALTLNLDLAILPVSAPAEAKHRSAAKPVQTQNVQGSERPLIVAQLPALVAAKTADRPPPGRTRSIVAVRTAEAPVIDGHLTEAAWEQAAVADRFWVSDQDRAPAEPTEARVMFDSEMLYVAFRVFDRVPERIEAQQIRRDAGLGFDDTVVVEIDAGHNFRDISRFSVNARGTQQDEIAGGRAGKIDWKGDWRAAAVRTNYGWSVEIAIPFQMLSYPDGARVFGINFVRYHNRASERSHWADLTPQFKPEEMGQLTELVMPTAERQRLTVMPYVLAGVNTPDKRGRIRDRLIAGGADIRFQPRADSTGLISLNPDFSQIESQFATANFSYTEKAVSDPRPFFLEGSGFFNAGRNNLYFYSNRIPSFDAGAKYFGRHGNTQVGGFATTAPDGRNDFGMRLLQELDATNFASLSTYATRRDTLNSQVVVGQFNGRQPSGLNYSADIASSQTSGLAGDTSHARGVLGWTWKYWYVSANADHYGTAFNSANGLLPADLPGTRGTSESAGYYRVYGSGPIYAARADVSLSARQTHDGRLQNRNTNISGYLEFANEMRAGLYFNDGRYRPVTSKRAVFSRTVNDDHYWTATFDFNTRSTWLGYGLSHSDGRLGGGDYRFDSVYVWVKPRADLSFNASVEVLENFGTFKQTTLAAKWDVTPTDAVGARIVVLDGAKYSRITYGRQVRKGTDVFAVIDKAPDLKTLFSVKLLFTLP